MTLGYVWYGTRDASAGGWNLQLIRYDLSDCTDLPSDSQPITGRQAWSILMGQLGLFTCTLKKC